MGSRTPRQYQLDRDIRQLQPCLDILIFKSSSEQHHQPPSLSRPSEHAKKKAKLISTARTALEFSTVKTRLIILTPNCFSFMTFPLSSLWHYFLLCWRPSSNQLNFVIRIRTNNPPLQRKTSYLAPNYSPRPENSVFVFDNHYNGLIISVEISTLNETCLVISIICLKF